MIRLPFGVHKGERLDNVDESYLWWLVGRPDLQPSLRQAIREQLGFDDDYRPKSAAAVLPGIIWRWLEHMREEHGHDDEAATIIEAGFDTLKHLCEEVTGREWPDELPPLPPPPPPRAVTAGSRPWGVL